MLLSCHFPPVSRCSVCKSSSCSLRSPCTRDGGTESVSLVCCISRKNRAVSFCTSELLRYRRVRRAMPEVGSDGGCASDCTAWSPPGSEEVALREAGNVSSTTCRAEVKRVRYQSVRSLLRASMRSASASRSSSVQCCRSQAPEPTSTRSGGYRSSWRSSGTRICERRSWKRKGG